MGVYWAGKLKDPEIQCPIKGCCLDAGYRCNKQFICPWLHYETKVGRTPK